jgi:hypothetical protein
MCFKLSQIETKIFLTFPKAEIMYTYLSVICNDILNPEYFKEIIE